MWFLILGLLLAMTWSLQRIAAAVAESSALFRRRLFQRFQGSTFSLVLSQGGLVLMDPSPHANRLQSLAAQAFRLRSFRVNLLHLCLSEAAAWLLLIVGALTFQVGGVFVLAAGMLMLVIPGTERLRSPGSAVVHLGLFLLIAEMAARFTMGSGAEADWFRTLLAENRPLPVAALSLGMAVIAMATGIEFLAFAAALLGLFSGALSLNAAVALMWGERVGLAARLWWTGRGQVLSVRLMTRVQLQASLIAWPLALILLGFLRDFVGTGLYGRSALPETLMAFLGLSALTAIPFLAMAVVLGHFRGAKVPEDLMERSLPPKVWLSSVGLRSSDLLELLMGLTKRQTELDRLLSGFQGEEWTKVPPPLREATQREAEHVGISIRGLEKRLLERNDFSEHGLS